MLPPLSYMMQNTGTLADEFDRILGLRARFAGLVLAGAGAVTGGISDEAGTQITDEAGTAITDE